MCVGVGMHTHVIERDESPRRRAENEIVLGGKMILKENLKSIVRKCWKYIGEILLTLKLGRKIIACPTANHDSESICSDRRKLR